MRAVDVRLVGDWIFKVSDGRSWFHRENIEPGANALPMHRVDQRLLIDGLTARSVDEVSAISHRAEELCANHQLGVRLERDVDADYVGGAGHVQRRVLSFNSEAFRF